MTIPIDDAEVIVFEDAFPASVYVDDVGNALVDPAELDREIQHVQAEASGTKKLHR